MRIVGRFLDKRQVGFAVDSLRNAGFDRKDMIVSFLGKDHEWDNTYKALHEAVLVQTERDSVRRGELEPFGEGIQGLTATEGIIVVVETPKHDTDRVRGIMEQSGAVDIIQD